MKTPIIYEGNEPYIFVSYSHKNSQKVWQLIDELNKRNFRIWYDSGIGPGTEFNDTIAKKIKNCEVLLSYNTEDLYQSKYCMQELLYASGKQKNIINIVFDDEMPDWYELRFYHTYQQLPVPDNADAKSIADELEKSEFLWNCRSSNISEDVEQPTADESVDDLIINNADEKSKTVLQEYEIEKALLINHNNEATPDEKAPAPEINNNTNSKITSSLSVGQNMTEEDYASEGFDIQSGVLIKYINKPNKPMATDLTVPQSVRVINEEAFQDCIGLTSITIPDSVRAIEKSAFYGCIGLTRVTIPNSVKKIGAYTFWGCVGLTSINIPDSITEIGLGAFWNCSGLTDINIPNGVTEIGACTFANCTSLTSVNIPNSVTEIGVEAFARCTSLKSVKIPDCIAEIERRAFYGCTELTIICTKGSYAEKYAKNNKIRYSTIE